MPDNAKIISDKQRLMDDIAKVEARFADYLSNREEVLVSEQTAAALSQAVADLRNIAVAKAIILLALKKKIMDIPALMQEKEDPKASPEIFAAIPSEILPVVNRQIAALTKTFAIKSSELTDEPIPEPEDDTPSFVEMVKFDMYGLWGNAQESVKQLTPYAAALARDAYHHNGELPLSDQKRAGLMETFSARVAGIKDFIHDIEVIDTYFYQKTGQVNPPPPKSQLN